MSNEHPPVTRDHTVGAAAGSVRHIGLLALLALAIVAAALIVLNGREPYGGLPEP